ncbi:MAG: penicillin acylase family protein [Bacteroidia bacterium]|nr:penicillin acylase family protein [Bacteroidia bacterium]
MRRVAGILFLIIGIGLVYFLNNSWNIKDTPLPPFGKLLNPFSGIWQNSESATDFESYNLKSIHVKENIKVVFDDRMVPHIYAQNLQDALFAQGYVEAYHRLFQMDISTRSPDGKLSEIFGENLLNYDKTQRRLGLGYAADNAIKGWAKHPEEFKNIQSYVQGVNHYIHNLSQKDFPLEYKLLDFEPSEWSVRHSALLLKAMTQTLAGYEEDVEMSNALKLLGPEDFKAIYPEYNPKDNPVIQGPYAALSQEMTGKSSLAKLEYFLNPTNRPKSPEGIGSNNWAVSGSKTKTGKPLLANDPHLGLSLPSVWYEIAITTPEFSARGVTLLGMPGIMIGFNQNIAWGETNVGHDMMDYYKIKWANSEKMQYYFDGKTKDVDLRIESIKVKGQGTVKDTVRYTAWGPIVDDKNSLALRWIAHDEAPGKEFMTFVSGMTSNNYDEYLANTSEFYAPAQNFVYADNSGEIGLRVNGSIPIKNQGQGRLTSDGDSSIFGWKGIVPRDHNPQERNPTKGYVTSANQWSTTPEYPNYYNGSFEPFRGRMINRILRDAKGLTIEEMQEMQQSTYSIEAEESLPHILAALDSSMFSLPEIDLLQSWDYNYTADSKAALLYNVLFKNFQKALWDEVYNHMDSIALPLPDSWVTILLLEENKESNYFDILSTPEKETFSDICNLAMSMTLKDSTIHHTWSESKNASIPHLIRLPAFSHTFTENEPISGHKYVLNAMQSTFGPSWRMVVSLEDNPTAYGIYPGGQSGNPASPFYKNMIDKWRTGAYDKLELSRSAEDIKNVLFKIEINHED